MNIDREVLSGFIDEAKGYLPRILDDLESFRRDPARHAELEEAHRLMHSIKGASAMVGLTPLSHVAYLAEECLDAVMAGERGFSSAVMETLAGTVEAIDTYLELAVGTGFDPADLVADVVVAYRRLDGLPEADDAAQVAKLLGGTAAFAAPAPPTPAAPAAEIAPDLLATFQLEAAEHLGQIGDLLRRLERQPEDRESLQGIRRSVHTLKGSAGLVGLVELSHLAHRAEDLLDRLYEGAVALSPEILGLLFETADALEDLAARRPEGEGVVGRLYARFEALLAAPVLAAGAPAAGEPPAPRGEAGYTGLRPAVAARPSAAPEALRPAGTTGSVVRVPIERLDELVRLVSELVVHRSVFERHMADLGRQVEDLGDSTGRLRRLANRFETESEVRAPASPRRALAPAFAGPGVAEWPVAGFGREFDALELDSYTQIHLLSRDLTETSSDLATVGGELKTTLGDFDAYLTRLGRLTRDVQGRLMRLRMVPLSTLSSRLHRTVRVTAEGAGKEVAFSLEGHAVEIDKTVLEAVADPLMHLLRNAVDHGIEPAALRQAIGKPHAGQVRLSASNEGSQVVLVVRDDGAGMDAERLGRAAVRAGLLSEEAAAALPAGDLNALAFLPGISTAAGVSEISGRGVGLDVVKAAISQLKGTVSVTSTPGAGTTFTIRLPLTLAVTRVLLVEAYGETLAVPLAAIAQILRVGRGEIERLGEDRVLRLSGKVYPVLALGQALGLPRPEEEVARPPMLILHLGGWEVALEVDEIVAAREVVVKPLGPLLARVPAVAGATLMGDGGVVLILSPGELRGAAVAAEAPSAAVAAPAASSLDVMLVDDSLSVRRVLTHLVAGAGWNPIPAKDGIEALEMMQRLPRRPDVVLLDIEMPRMDGYALIATLRGQPAYRDMPVVMLTSRAGDKHRQKAFELGATDYLVKPYQDETLLAVVRRVVQDAKRDGF